MNFENIPKEYFDLLKEKKYSELNQEEESLVLKWIQKEDYDAYHYLINESILGKRKEDIEIPEFPLIRKQERSSLIHRRLPLSSVAAMLGIAVFVTAVATFHLSERRDLSNSNFDSYPTLSVEEDEYPMNFIIEM